MPAPNYTCIQAKLIMDSDVSFMTKELINQRKMLTLPNLCLYKITRIRVSLPFKFHWVCLFFLLFLFTVLQRSMAKVHWPPMNKFACKLHGYIVYLVVLRF